MSKPYQVIVVGAGHAGCEAARACARLGLRTAMITMNLDLIAQMSCNPAVGGIAKGHLVREIDALGGVMGEVTDAVGIQFRLLNTSRGPAVWSPRAQCDKKQYRLKMREVLEAEPNLRIIQAEVARLVITDGPRGASQALNCATDACSRPRRSWSRPEHSSTGWRTSASRRTVAGAAVRRLESAGRSASRARSRVEALEDGNSTTPGWAHHRVVPV